MERQMISMCNSNNNRQLNVSSGGRRIQLVDEHCDRVFDGKGNIEEQV